MATPYASARHDVVWCAGTSPQHYGMANGVDKGDAFHIEIEMAGGVLEFRVSDGGQWAALDRWTPADRSVIDGQIGFFVPGQDEVRLSSFGRR
jgi:hypothetical protein